MLLVAAGTAYAGISYYYSDKFFEGTTINGIDCSGKTAYQVEQLIAKKVENYSIEVDSRNLDPQTISGDQIGYKYVSDGSVLKLLTVSYTHLDVYKRQIQSRSKSNRKI